MLGDAFYKNQSTVWNVFTYVSILVIQAESTNDLISSF